MKYTLDRRAGPGEIIHFTCFPKLCSSNSRVSFYPILINTYPLDSFTVSSSSCWWLRSLAALVGLGLGQPFSHETPFYKNKCKYVATQLIYLQISKGQCCFLLVVNIVTRSLGQPFSHENPSVNAALHGFHMQIHLSIIIIHLLPRWGHSCLNLTEKCQSLFTHQIYRSLIHWMSLIKIWLTQPWCWKLDDKNLNI